VSAVAADAISLERVADLKRREDARFVAAHPRSLAMLERGARSTPRGVPMNWMASLWDHPPVFVDSADGGRFLDIDGNEYADFSLGITAASGGHAHPAVVEAACSRIARGFNFGQPTQDSVFASEELARRFGLPSGSTASAPRRRTPT
jgi:glutamate-1-semialdehyde 2,1-aminomutase